MDVQKHFMKVHEVFMKSLQNFSEHSIVHVLTHTFIRTYKIIYIHTYIHIYIPGDLKKTLVGIFVLQG